MRSAIATEEEDFFQAVARTVRELAIPESIQRTKEALALAIAEARDKAQRHID